MATGSYLRSRDPEGWKGVRMRNRMLHNIPLVEPFDRNDVIKRHPKTIPLQLEVT